MSEFLVEEMQHNKGAKIKVIGCGGGGGNMINHMVKMGLNDLDLIAANTDAQAISNSLAKTKIQGVRFQQVFFFVSLQKQKA